jgi:hypothetical protein
VNYYNQIQKPFQLSKEAKSIESLTTKEGKVYFFDFYAYLKYFNKRQKFDYAFGDVNFEVKNPGFTKTRPIKNKSSRNVILKWEKIRHFITVKNDKPFDQKKNMLVFRGKVHASQPHRVAFLEKYHTHPHCDIGRVNKNELNPAYLKNRLTMKEQLEYKYILSLEGNDVASNLKWIMSSNSIVVMPKPKFESWYMEAKLIPDVHFIAIKADYSDLMERIEFYEANPDKASNILKNAQGYRSDFYDSRIEDLCQILTLEKYFVLSGQEPTYANYLKEAQRRDIGL